MKIVGVEGLTFGVDDIAVARRFWSDFGLELVEESAKRVVFNTQNRNFVEVRDQNDAHLPPALVSGNNIREITWGVENDDDLENLSKSLTAITDFRQDQSSIRLTDPSGYGIAFRVSNRKSIEDPEIGYNAPTRQNRFDERGPVYNSASPRNIAHVVVQTDKLEDAVEFYEKRLQFRITDSYPGSGTFLRANGNNEHHNLFLLQNGQLGFHHVAFGVNSIHELFGGGINMTEKGWETHIGPGRHPISSAYFWYFENPCGGAAEYGFDTDYVTDDWRPSEWEPGPEAYAEWALPSGVEKFKSR